MFTGDAFNGLINCYKELLDLVKRKKITVKSLCTMNLSQLMGISLREGDNGTGCRAGVSREGGPGSLLGSSRAAGLCSLPAHTAACCAAHAQLPSLQSKPHAEGTACDSPAA